MRTIIKYVFFDLIRNKVVIVYALILALLSFSLLSLDNNTSKGLLGLLNVTLLFVPLISVLFATIYFFNSIEFIELLLAQPVKRDKVLFAEFVGLAASLSITYALGIGIPVLLLAPGMAALTLLLSGVLLTLIFCALALLVFVLFKDKTKAIGASLVTALFFTLLFDGILLMFIYSFSDYPLEKAVLALIGFNPVDLARVLMLLQLDVAVLMGYSGALFQKFLGSAMGSAYSVACLLTWIGIPVLLAVRRFRKKDL